METAFQELASQSAAALRRAAERSARGLRSIACNGAKESQREAIRELVADCRGDLAGLQALRATSDALLRDGIEADDLLAICVSAGEAASATKQLIAAIAAAHPSDADGAEMQVIAEQVEEVLAYFRRRAEWLLEPLATPAPDVLERLDSLPPVATPIASAHSSPSDVAGV